MFPDKEGSNNKPESQKKELPIRLIAIIGGGVIVVAAIIVLLFVFVFNGDRTIGSLEELRAAIADRKAINCTITINSGDGQSATAISNQLLLQTNDDWSKVRADITAFGETTRALAIKNNNNDNFTTYGWMLDSENGFKMAQAASTIHDGVGSMVSEDLTEDNIKLECQPNNQADFDVPSNVTFEEVNTGE